MSKWSRFLKFFIWRSATRDKIRDILIVAGKQKQYECIFHSAAIEICELSLG
jgi:hypothetical protein